MNKLQLSTILLPEVQGDEQFFARKVRAKDFNGLMDPIIGFDHFELSTDTFGPHPHAGMSALSYVFEDSAPYHSLDSQGNNIIVTPGSLLWTWAGSGVVHTEFPFPDGASVEGLQLFVNIAAARKHLYPKSVLIDKSQMPEIKEDGVLVRVVSGETGSTKNQVHTPDPLTMLHIFLDEGKEFTHVIPAKWSGTVYAVEGHFDFTTNEETLELEEGMVLAMAFSDANEPLTFRAISNCQFILISGIPLQEKIFTQGAMAMDSPEALAKAMDNYKNGKMGFIVTEGQNRKIISPV